MTTRQNVPNNFGEGGAGLTPGGSSVPAPTPAAFGGQTPPANPDLATVLWALLGRHGPAVANYAALALFGATNATDRQDGMEVLVVSDRRKWFWNAADTRAASAGQVFLAADAPSVGRWNAVAFAADQTPTVHIDLKGAILAAGTPLGAYAGSTPGITLNNAKAVGVRWKGGTLTSIWTSLVVPLDLDPTFPVQATFLVSKSGATATDVVSVTVAAYAQTTGALEDAGANLGAATPAMTTAQASLPAKTVTKLQAPIYLPPTPPAVLSLSLTPTGTLATDDLMVEGAWLEYVRRPAVPRVVVDLRAAVLSTGVPMAAWANNAGASAPGVTLDNSKDVEVRWNNQATLTPIFSAFQIPADMDVTKPSVVVALVSKSGATGGDTMTLDVGLYQQVAGALEDATAGSLGLGGTTSAIASPTATAKTVSKLVLGIPGNTFSAYPGQVTVSVQPTNGTLGTDDGGVCGLWLEYAKKPTTVSFFSVDFKAGILATGVPMAAWANNAGASAPGVTLNNSKALGVRWNNQATLTAVWSERDFPLDFDPASAATLTLLVSKNGATASDTSPFDVALYQQVPGALEDAGPSYTGTTVAIAAPAATAKTVSRLTLAIPAGTFSAAPGRLSLSLKPHDGLLGTDDALLCGCGVEYTPKTY